LGAALQYSVHLPFQNILSKNCTAIKSIKGEWIPTCNQKREMPGILVESFSAQPRIKKVIQTPSKESISDRISSGSTITPKAHINLMFKAVVPIHDHLL
jgi:hypothetical protein